MWKYFKKPIPPWQTKLLYALLCMLPLTLYFRWLNFDIFTYGDWSYKHLATLTDTLQLSTWIGNTGFGSFDELAWRAPFSWLFGLFAAATIPLNVSEKFIVFIPIALTSILAPYMLVRQITGNRLASVIGALFYATNTYFLAINPQGHQLLTLAANILTIAFALFIKALDGSRQSTYVAAALALWLASIIDFRLFYIGVILFGGYLLYWRLMRSEARPMPLRQLMIFGGITLLLQIGWLTATFFSGGNASQDAVLGRALFGSEYWDLSSALTLHHPFWTGTTTSWFISNGIPLVFWLVPIGVCVALIIERKNTYVIFFALVAVVGILLSKQTSQPFSALYPFLFEHLPGFSAFRESTKFYYLVALGYTVIVASLVVSLQRLRPKLRFGTPLFIGVVTILGILCLVNALPYLTGSMNKLLAPRTMPADYAHIANQLDKASSEYYRTLWVPIAPRWSYYSSKHPRVNGTNLIAVAQGQTAADGYNSPAEKLRMIITSPLFKHYLDAGSVKYVYVPLRDTGNQDDFFPFYGDDRQFYIDTLDKVDFLSRVDIGTKDVVVYENKTFHPYITTTAQLYTLPAHTDIESLSNFMTNELTEPFSFGARAKDDTMPPAHTATDLYGALTPDSITKGALTSSLHLQHPGELHLGKPKPKISYTTTKGKLRFLATNSTPLVVDGQSLNIPEQVTTLGDVPLDSTRAYFARLDNNVIPLDASLQNRQLGTASKNITVLSTNRANLLQNGSFENGSWRQKVGDCNAYDRHPGIGMAIDNNEASDGKQSLELAASRHTACTSSNDMVVEGGKHYLVSFKFKAPYAKRISFATSFDGKTAVKHIFTQSGTAGWRTARYLVTAPKGTSRLTLQLYGLPPANHSFGISVATTHYDEVTVSPVAIESDYAVNAKSDGQILPLKAGKHTISYISPEITKENLIANGSLERGNWQKQPSVCDDQEGKLNVDMRTGNVASAGKKSLELRSQGRVACTGPGSIPVAENNTYLLSFDHQSPNNSAASFSMSFNDVGKTSVGQTFRTKPAWQTYNKVITVPPGATEARLNVYTSSNATEGITHTNRYDNFQLLAVPPASGRFYAVSQNPNLQAPKQTTFASVNQTKKLVRIAGAQKPFYLTLAETYSSGWKVALANQNLSGKLGSLLPMSKADYLDPKNHIVLDTHLNAWYIDPSALCAAAKTGCTKQADGSYDIALVVEFAPQRWFRIGLLLQAATVVGSVAYIILEKKNRKGWRAT